ncbi:MAG: methyltransferase domain-containing protein [Woeseiaceae bacterium]|nr:methyltransferase domain-containing protein [Woeseiaceae bacterium]
MSHEPEYHDNMVAMLELVWGEGYMAPGGPGNVAKMLEGLEPQGKRILDLGCGIGGPALEMAATHGAEVVGVDLEAPLVGRAERAARERGLDDRCRFRVVERGVLPFDDACFDIVTSAGAVTQTADKTALVAELRRLLKPGGWLSCYEWLSTGGELSEDMRYWIELEGLTYALWELADYGALLAEQEFEDLKLTDASAWYRRESRAEYERLRGELYPRMVELLGRKDADHFVENWRAMVVVIESGEMQQGYFRGRKPGG